MKTGLCSEPHFSFPSGFTQGPRGSPSSHAACHASGAESCPTTGLSSGSGTGCCCAVPLRAALGALRPPPPPWKAPGASGSGLLALPAQDCGPAAGLLRREHFLCKRRRGPRPCPRPGVPNGAAVRARAVPWEPPPADRAWTADRRGSAPLAPRSARTGGACGLAGVHRGAGRKPGLQPAQQGPGSAGREGLQGASGRTLLNPRPCLGSRRCLPSVAREFQRW